MASRQSLERREDHEDDWRFRCAHIHNRHAAAGLSALQMGARVSFNELLRGLVEADQRTIARRVAA